MFFVGQKVVRTGGTDDPTDPYPYPKIGEVCTVAGTLTILGEKAVLLIEYPLPEGDGFRAVYLKPVVEKKTDISIFTKMLNPNDQRVDA